MDETCIPWARISCIDTLHQCLRYGREQCPLFKHFLKIDTSCSIIYLTELYATESSSKSYSVHLPIFLYAEKRRWLKRWGQELLWVSVENLFSEKCLKRGYFLKFIKHFLNLVCFALQMSPKKKKGYESHSNPYLKLSIWITGRFTAPAGLQVYFGPINGRWNVQYQEHKGVSSSSVSFKRVPRGKVLTVPPEHDWVSGSKNDMVILITCNPKDTCCQSWKKHTTREMLITTMANLYLKIIVR